MQQSATLGKYEKLTLLDVLKIHFQRFFGLSFLHLTSNGPNGVNRNVDHGFMINFCIFSKGTQPFDFIKPNVIQKLAYKVKYINQINGCLIIFFLNLIFLNYLARL